MHKIEERDLRSWTSTSCGSSLVGLNYRKSQAGGDDPHRKIVPQPYDMSYFASSDNIGEWRWTDIATMGPQWRTGSGPSCGFAPTCSIPEFSANARNELLLKVLRKGRGDSFYSSLFLAEGREAIGMIADSATRLAKAYTAVRRLDVPRAINILTGANRIPQGAVRRFGGDFSRNWLALQWGWLPLVSDIAEGANALMLREAPQPKFIRKFRTRGRVDGTVYGAGGGFSAKGSAYRTIQYVLLVRQVNYSSPSRVNVWDVSQVAWELTPFSMIADYFLPIGSAIEARAISEELDATLVTTECTFKKLSMGTSPYYETRGMISNRTEISMRRTVGAPGSAISLPVFQPDLSLKRMLNGLSLLWQVTH